LADFPLWLGLGSGRVRWVDRAKLRERRRIGRPERRDRRSGLGRGPPSRDAAETAGETVPRLPRAALLRGKRVSQRGPGHEAALDDDLAEALAGPLLLLERLRKLLLGEEAGGDQDPSDLGCGKLCRVHDSLIGSRARFVSATVPAMIGGWNRSSMRSGTRRWSASTTARRRTARSYG